MTPAGTSTAGGEAPAASVPGSFARGRLAILLATALTLVWSWSRLEGYPLADVVEDLEWTEALLAGEHVIDSEATRPFGFLLLLMPLFAVAKLGALLGLGAEAMLVMHAARLMQVALTLLLVGLVARFARRAAGGSVVAGLSAAALLGFNPLILRWGIEPISGVATGIFVLLAAEQILFAAREGGAPPGSDPVRRDPRRRGLIAGLTLGAAALTAYKSIAIVAPVFLFALVLGRRRGLSRAALVAGLGACLLAQSLGDLAYHGAFGESLRVYGLQNIGNIVPVAIHRVGEWTGSQTLIQAARDLYEACRDAHKLAPSDVVLRDRVEELTSLNPRTWYVTHLHQALTWPGLALLVIGLARAVRRRVWPLLIPALAVVLYVGLMSYKGSKDFRLWLPILSFCAAVGGFGAAGLVAVRGGRSLAALLVLAGAGLGLRTHAGVNQLQYAGYWRAMDHVGGLAADGASSSPPVTVGAAFHWAVYARAGEGVELIKLPLHLDGWERHAPEERARNLAALAELDFFIAHLAVVTSRAELCAFVGEHFELEAGFYRAATEASPGPVFVFRNRDSRVRGVGGAGRGESRQAGTGSALLLRTREGSDAAARAAELPPGAPLGFDDPSDLRFLGFEYRELPGDGPGWITYHWSGGSTAVPYRFLVRVTQGDATAWSGDHAPGHGWLPTDAWPASGLVLSEGYPVLEPWDRDVPWSLWVGVAAPDGAGERLLTAVRPGDGRPVAELSPPGAPPTAEGWRTVAAGLVSVGGAAP